MSARWGAPAARKIASLSLSEDSMPQPADVPVTLAEIARIAGVGRAAVSNWRRRHDSFPGQVGGTDASPQFSLRDVEAWLRQQGKLQEAGRLERLWPQFEAMGDRSLSGQAIAAVGERVQGAQVVALGAGGAGSLVDRAADVAAREGGRRTFDFLFGRWADTYVRQVSVTPAELARLMVDIGLMVLTGGIEGRCTTVLDPACGTGSLLLAAAQDSARNGRPAPGLVLFGVERDPTLAALAAVRLGFISGSAGREDTAGIRADIRVGDSLREDPSANVRADLVVCNPPFNERDWGHEELATDPRWTYGLPPRTESELGWVEHALARLRPGGAAVLLMPPAVASRRAGRRIRGALLRSGALRGIIALPAGSAQPHSVSLHLWILQVPETDDGRHRLFLLDAASSPAQQQVKRTAEIAWPRLRERVLNAVNAYPWGVARGRGVGAGAIADLPEGCVAVPVVSLLDDHVDLTPARHVPDAAPAGIEVAESWSRFGGLVRGLGELSRTLSALDLSADGRDMASVTVGDLNRAGALMLRPGLPVAPGVCEGDRVPPGAIPVLTVPDLMLGGRARAWLRAADIAAYQAGGSALTIVDPGEVVVVGVERAFRVWVHAGDPLVLGPQMFALRADPAMLDSWFLAGCLRAPGNIRQASTHASTSARVDVRKLRALQLPLAQQRPYGQAFRAVTELEATLADIGDVGAHLLRALNDRLAAGGLSSG
jgi:SAM-dependent methyltransferase